MTAPIPAFEKARLATLRSLRLLDTLPEPEFDDLVEAACAVMDVPIALVSLVESDRQWFKARRGLEVCQTSRDVSFCAHAILGDEALVVPDATLDPRFADNELVTGDFGLRFYAGAPIVIDGQPIGSLCCIDTRPRTATGRQVSALAALARQVGTLMKARLRAETFAESERRFVAFLDNAPAVAYLKDEAGRMRFVNRRFGLVYDGPSVIGRRDEEWLPSEIATEVVRHDAAVRESGRAAEFEEHVPLIDGTPRVWQSMKFPVEVGGRTWIGGVSVDVTALREAEAAVRRQNAALSAALVEAEAATRAAKAAALRFEQLFAGLPVACYTYDAEATIHEWNGAAEALWGIPAEEAFLASVYGTAVGEANRAAKEAIVRRVFEGEASVGVERRETMRDGSERWLMTSTFPLRSPAGTVVGAVSANVDVTDRKASEAALREKEERFRTVVESLHEGLLVQDEKGATLLWNRSAERVLGLSGFDMLGKGFAQWRTVREDGSPLPAEERPAARVLREGIANEGVLGMFHPDGSLRWISVHAAPVVSDDGQATSVVASFLDVTERKEQERRIREHLAQIEAYSLELEGANARLEGLATTDGLTGLRNHRFFQDFLRRKIEHCQGAGLPLSIALLDVDRFKAYNDDFGHQAGDAVLREVARVLEAGTRPGDLVARYGGEEFVIVMPGADEAAACAVAERVRALLEAAPFDLRAVTASFGVAVLGEGAPDAPRLIRAADEALYGSKGAGRNRVTAWAGATAP